MRRPVLFALVVTVLSALACNDLTAPTRTVPAVIGAPKRTLVIPTTAPQVSAGYFHTCALKSDGTVVCWGENDFGQGTAPVGLTSVAQVGAGGDHSCALKTDGTVTCWGSDASGQSTGSAGLTGVAQISVGTNHACAVKTDETLACWGSNENGQANVVALPAPVTQASAGYAHTCVVLSDQTVACWGLNNFGQTDVPAGLGSVAKVSAATYHTCALKTNGTVVCWGYPFSDPIVPDGLAPVTQLSSAGAHNCALHGDATVTCWGQNNYGETSPPGDIGSVSQVSAGAAHSCAVRTDGTVACWGHDGFGQSTVPDGLNLNVNVAQSIGFTSVPPDPAYSGEKYTPAATGGGSGNPVTFSSLTPSVCTVSGSEVSFAAAGDCTIAADQAGAPGYNAADQATQVVAVTVAPPLPIPAPSAQISAGGYHSCAALVTGPMKCWGNNDYGQVNVPSGTAAVSMAGAGYFHTCSLTTDGILHCGGGDGTLGPMPPLSQVAQFDAGEQYVMCALQTNRVVVCWGNNGGGNATVPPGLANVEEVAVGHNHACARKIDGTVVCWGLSLEGETSVPAGLANVTQLTAGGFHSCALKSEGSLSCWGNNSFGESTVPSGIGSVIQVSAGYQHTCAVKSDATVVCWGNPDNGRISVPANLPPIMKVSAGRYHTCAVTTVGNVLCWGDNGFGQTTVPAGLNVLGLQTITFTSSAPVPALVGGSYSVTATGGGSGNPVAFTSSTPGVCSVSGNTVALLAIGTCNISASQAAGNGYFAASDVSQSFTVTPALVVPGPSAQISAGGYHTCASTRSGQMICWGDNDYGQANVPSGSATVSQAGAGYFHTCSLTPDGVVHCGAGDGTLGSVPALSPVIQFDAGEQYVMCALQTNATVACWGNNGGGNATVPAGLVNVAEVAVGQNHSCARKLDGSVVCWGLNLQGQADPPAGLANVTQLSAGGFHSCALKADGTVVCWGNNPRGETNVPAGLISVQQVSAGYQHSCAVRSDGTVTCWGNSDNGRTAVPANLPPAARVSAGRYHTCAMTTAGYVVCWGDNGFGQSTPPSGLNLLGLQSIAFTSVPPAPALTGGTYAVAATGGGSGNAVVFSSLTSSVCTVTGNVVSLVAVGICTIAADQPAGNGYDAAEQATQTFGVSSSSQVLTFTSTPPLPALVGATYALTATGGQSGNPIVFGSFTPGVCTTAGSVVTFVQIGSCIITANQAAGGGYDAATQISQVITVMGTQTVVITSTPPNPALTGTSYSMAVTGGASGNPVVLSSKTPAVCTVGGRSAKLIAPGTCIIAGNQAGAGNYVPAAEVTQSFTVFIPQTIKFTSSTPNKPVIGGIYLVTATGGASGNAVTFSTLTPTICSMSGSTAQFLAAGTCNIAANQGGTTIYAAAPQVTQSVKIK